MMETLASVSRPSQLPYNETHTQSKSTFLRLPLEVRLSVFQHLNALALLQVASTCSQLHSDVHSYPSIVRKSEGYSTKDMENWEDEYDKKTSFAPWNWSQMAALVEQLSHHQKEMGGSGSVDCLSIDESNCPATEFLGLGISNVNVYFLEDDAEKELWTKRYPERQKQGPRLMLCERCGYVEKEELMGRGEFFLNCPCGWSSFRRDETAVPFEHILLANWHLLPGLGYRV
ncbi:hypothetical protein BJ508DRAFT_377643 [Ascobolus immersus RN42]|uniref:F-box domain-containing protein n=1 Tax=Ascobolus immersus RN42 TaxID=1160509 RepID=A0A3N4HZZ6_ASCIM|nr:hypothetical protein BJ508DRAFT_377643 [Ascobolus immersus RN42]